MIVHYDSQFMATLCTASFQNILTICRTHTLAETMYTHTSMNLGLISPLRHYTFLSLPEISIKFTNGYYTATNAAGQFYLALWL